MTKNCTESRQLHGSPNDVKLESAGGMISDRTARRMARTGNVSSCVFYQSKEAQMLRGHRTKLLLSAENKVHTRGSARGIWCAGNGFDATCPPNCYVYCTKLQSQSLTYSITQVLRCVILMSIIDWGNHSSPSTEKKGKQLVTAITQYTKD